jgi:hypothetical protein
VADPTELESALRAIVRDLGDFGKPCALVGGLAVSVRAEVRFTRDVDIAVRVTSDMEAEALVHALGGRGYRAVASVEHETKKRLATVRLLSADGVKVDLLFASSGLEPEIVDRAVMVDLGVAGRVPVARSEELLSMKVLSMNDDRLQDRIDAQGLIRYNPDIDLGGVRQNLALVHDRGFDRNQDLAAKLGELLDT